MSKATMLILIGGRSAVPSIIGALQFIHDAMICECKSGKKLVTNDLHRLRTKAERLGGSYCTKIFIASGCKNLSEDFRDTANSNGIRLIENEELKNLSEILKNEMLKPTYGRR